MKTCTNIKRDGKGNDGCTEAVSEKLVGLLKRHEGAARSLACKLARNAEDAKELVQEASVRALRHWDSFDPVKSFQAWYLRIVKNAFVDSRRRYEVRFGVPLLARVKGDEHDSMLIDLIADGEPGVQEQAERGELAREIEKVLGEIRPHHREIVKLCDMEGMSYDEAAQELGLSSGTVRSRLFRARRVLKGRLTKWA